MTGGRTTFLGQTVQRKLASGHYFHAATYRVQLRLFIIYMTKSKIQAGFPFLLLPLLHPIQHASLSKSFRTNYVRTFSWKYYIVTQSKCHFKLQLQIAKVS